MSKHVDKNVENKYGLNLESEWFCSLGVEEKTGVSPQKRTRTQ